MSVALLRRKALPVTAWGFTGDEPGADCGGSTFRRILLAVSASRSSVRALTLVANLARENRSKVFVIHLRERLNLGRGGYWDLETGPDAGRLIARVQDELLQFGIAAETWTDSSPADLTGRNVALAARLCSADLVVIGSPRGKSALWATISRSVSHSILHQTTVPVLVVP